jgi:CheY-like chemotaxis protein
LHRIELLQDVREGVARVERIARELKAFSHVDDGPARPIDVCEELDAALQLVAHELRHRARLTCRYRPIPAVRARAAELRQVFVNVLLNAIHAIPEGQAHLHEIRVTTRMDSRDRVAIEVADTGAGIPPSAARRVFEPFFTTTPGAGLGLGLTVSRDVVAALDGEIMIDSIAGRGTTVRISIPSTDEDVEDAHLTTPAQVPAATLAERRILIIDDDRPVAAAIALELNMHDIVVTESGREALTLLRRDKDFDLILCDLMMPEVTGMEVYEALRTMDPALVERVVLMTGGAFTAQARRFLSEVDAQVLEKPFQAGQLLALVEATRPRRPPPDDLD